MALTTIDYVMVGALPLVVHTMDVVVQIMMRVAMQHVKLLARRLPIS